MTNAIKTLPYLVAGYNLLRYPNVWVHELGHWCAMKALFADVNPSIELTGTYLDMVFGVGRGEVHWGGRAEVLTEVGNILGFKYARAAVSAAGPIVDFVKIALSLIAAKKINNFYTSTFLLGYSLKTIVHPTTYVISDIFYNSIPGGDFSTFAKYTNVPLNTIPFAIMAISALGLGAWYKVWKNKIEERDAIEKRTLQNANMLQPRKKYTRLLIASYNSE